MRAYPHRPDEASLLEDRDFYVSIFKPDSVIVGAAPATTEEAIWALNAERGLWCAAYVYAFEGPVEMVRNYLERSNSSFTMGLERRSPFDLGALMQQLASAVVVNDVALATRLCTLEPARYEVEGSTFIPAVQREFGIWQSLILGQPAEALQRLQQAEAALAGEKLPRATLKECTSMLALFGAVLGGDVVALNQALTQRAEAIATTYKSPSSRQEPDALLDLPGLALAAIARRQGLAPVTDAVCLPLAVAVA